MEDNTNTRENRIASLLEALKYHLSDSTALLTATTPLFAAFETFMAGISIENSINARLLGTGLTYAGLGRVFTKGMDLSRKLFKITPETKERVKQAHDAAYAISYNFLMSPLFYYIAGVRDIKQIALGTVSSMGLALIAGGPMGYSVDAFRDLTGLKNSERIPKIISKSSPKIKKSLVALLAAASIGLTAEVYNLKTQYENYSASKKEVSQKAINLEAIK